MSFRCGFSCYLLLPGTCDTHGSASSKQALHCRLKSQKVGRESQLLAKMPMSCTRLNAIIQIQLTNESFYNQATTFKSPLLEPHTSG